MLTAALIASISDHTEHIGLFSGGMLAMWLVSAAISTMPPYKGDNYWAVWAYGFLQFVGANLTKILPNIKSQNGGSTNVNIKTPAVAILLLLSLFALPLHAQTTTAPTPTQNTMNFSVGGSVLGVAGSTPAADVNLTLNPGLSGKLANLELRSDNIEAPSVNWQDYAGGVNYLLPVKFPTNSILAPLAPYCDAVVGVSRVVPAVGASTSNISTMAGCGLRWKLPSGVNIQVGEIDWLHASHSPFGNNTTAFSGKISYVFGQQ